MTIPVYKNYSRQSRNQCYCVTNQDVFEGGRVIQELHNSKKTTIADLCNTEMVDAKGKQPVGNAVTQVTQQKSIDYWVDRFEERAAIYEYEAGMDRESAQLKAINDIISEWCQIWT